MRWNILQTFLLLSLEFLANLTAWDPFGSLPFVIPYETPSTLTALAMGPLGANNGCHRYDVIHMRDQTHSSLNACSDC